MASALPPSDTPAPASRDATPRPNGLRTICVGSAAGLPLVGMAVACLWRPDFATALTLVPAWCWLAAGAASTIIVGRMRNRRLAAALAFAWFLLAIGWVEESRSLTRPVVNAVFVERIPPGRRFRVVSLNCASGTLCLSDLQRAAPDVVLLQESPGSDRVAHMAHELFGDEAGFLDSGDAALLARGRIEPHFVDKSGRFVIGIVSLAEGCDIGCVSLRLAPPPARFDIGSPEFWSEHAELRKTHRRQLEEILSQIGALSSLRTVIVGGDFNTVPLDRALDSLRPALADVFSGTGKGWGATGTNDWPLFRVDQIWTDSRIISLDAFAVPTSGSDHRMVVCDAIIPD